MANNVTELELARQAKKEGELTLRNLVRQAPIGICLINARTLVVDEVNENYLELVGKSRAELEERVIWDAIPEAAASYRPIMNEVILTGRYLLLNWDLMLF